MVLDQEAAATRPFARVSLADEIRWTCVLPRPVDGPCSCTRLHRHPPRASVRCPVRLAGCPRRSRSMRGARSSSSRLVAMLVSVHGRRCPRPWGRSSRRATASPFATGMSCACAMGTWSGAPLARSSPARTEARSRRSRRQAPAERAWPTSSRAGGERRGWSIGSCSSRRARGANAAYPRPHIPLVGRYAVSSLQTRAGAVWSSRSGVQTRVR
jgi:hypothetical protein